MPPSSGPPGIIPRGHTSSSPMHPGLMPSGSMHPGPIPPFQRFPGMVPQLPNLHTNTIGVPSNPAAAILRGFTPFQHNPGSTSKTNRKASMARNSKRGGKTRAQNETLQPELINKAVSILFFPVSVRTFILYLPLHVPNLFFARPSSSPTALKIWLKIPPSVWIQGV
jgi:hypothetical protein